MPRKRHLIPKTLLLAALTLVTLSACSSPAPKPIAFKPAAANTAITHPAVAVAKSMIGTPYHYGGASPRSGFDCSGLVYYSFKKAGMNTPRTTKTLYKTAFGVAPSALRQGDLLFFRIEGKVSHVGLYVGGSTFVHAPSSGKKVSYASLDNPYWRKRLIKAGRLF